jgi:hypothetical protein
MIPIIEILSIGSKLIDKIIPDPDARAKAQLDLAKLAQDGQLAELTTIKDVDIAQIKVNEEEAKSENLFKSGWRPFIGWVCGISLALYYIPMFVIGISLWVWACIEAKALVPRPDLGVMEILGLVASLLGMSTIRMIEKKNGVASGY